MPPIRDVMSAFELFQPTSVSDTLGILARHGSDAWVMAGGVGTCDLLEERLRDTRGSWERQASVAWVRAGGRAPFDGLKDRIRKPKVVIDLGGVNELRGVK